MHMGCKVSGGIPPCSAVTTEAELTLHSVYNGCSMTLEELHIIFEACDTDRSGRLDIEQAKFTLSALGYSGCLKASYPTVAETRAVVKQSSLDFPAFQALANYLRPQCDGHPMLPFARRGLTCGQLQAVHEAFVGSGWLIEKCETFNQTHRTEIDLGKERRMESNLYALDKLVIRPLTSAEQSARIDIPERCLKAAEIPPSPSVALSFAQLMNPSGLEIDFFVSHWWGHEFETTVRSVSKYVEKNLTKLQKASVCDVVLWICLFAVNQHNLSAEVGTEPEHGPFNAALSRSTHGVIMVLDEQSMPLLRLWCLYEVRRSYDFGKSFDIVTDAGTIADVAMTWGESFLLKLLTMSGANATASKEADRDAIQYAIANKGWRDTFQTLAEFVQNANKTSIAFSEFDAKVCQLVATPLLRAFLLRLSQDVSSQNELSTALGQCLCAIGMGATVSAADLTLLQEFGGNLHAMVKPRFGKRCSMLHAFSYFGNVEPLQALLDLRVAVDQPMEDDAFFSGASPLFVAADQGQEVCVRKLLIARAAVDNVVDAGNCAPLWIAAMRGYDTCVGELLAAQAAVDRVNDDGRTPLYIAAQMGHASCVRLLLAMHAAVDHTIPCGEFIGYTALRVATMRGHENCVRELLVMRAVLDENSAST